MSITIDILGAPGRDNAAIVRIDRGQSIERILLDCGEGCPAALRKAELQSIDHLLFSHFHIDHVAGFDAFVRANFTRAGSPVEIWGPAGTCEIIHHRLRGFLWNLHRELTGEWRVHEARPDGTVIERRFRTAEAFARAHEPPGAEQRAPAAGEGARRIAFRIIDAPAYEVIAIPVEHHGPCLAYLVREKPRVNIDPARLEASGLPPGPWLEEVRRHGAAGDAAGERTPAPGTIEIAGERREVAQLARELLVTTPGASVAYVTDLLLDAAAVERLAPALSGCGVLVCESQYREADAELALRNHHATAAGAARLARAADAGRLVLFHLSDRYSEEEWGAMLAEARDVFERTAFPRSWSLAEPQQEIDS